MKKIGNLSIKNINFYVFCISMQSCKDCQTVQTQYKTEVIYDFYHTRF